MLKRKCDKDKCTGAVVATTSALLFGWLAYCLIIPFQSYTWTF